MPRAAGEPGRAQMRTLNDLLTEIPRYQSGGDVDVVRRAYEFTREVHQGQRRVSGEPYDIHPLAVAGLLVEFKMDATTVAAGLLLGGKQPIVFRTFLEGAGMQAVAVGFPQQIHVAFDALESRWALAWKGRFLDAMTTWEERAMTPAKLLGTKPVDMPLRMPLARLTSASDAWPDACGADAYALRDDGELRNAFLFHVQDAVEEVKFAIEEAILRGGAR